MKAQKPNHIHEDFLSYTHEERLLRDADHVCIKLFNLDRSYNRRAHDDSAGKSKDSEVAAR